MLRPNLLLKNFKINSLNLLERKGRVQSDKKHEIVSSFGISKLIKLKNVVTFLITWALLKIRQQDFDPFLKEPKNSGILSPGSVPESFVFEQK